MAPSHLRTSGPLQAAVIALALGFLLRGTPATDPPATWPWFAAGYAALATVVPWLAGAYGPGEFTLRHWLVLGATFVAPVAAGAWLLGGTAYAPVGTALWALAALWLAHGAAALARRGRSAVQ